MPSSSSLGLDTVGLVDPRRRGCFSRPAGARTKHCNELRWAWPACAVTVLYASGLAAVAFRVGSTSTTPISKRSALDHVLQSGVMRVLCPLDYPPFGFRGASCPEDVAFGADVDAIMALARTLNASVLIVPTTWATLTDDAAESFSMQHTALAIGGITPTLARRQSGVGFSSPLLHSGKVLVANCGNPLLSRFDVSADPAALNLPGMRVYVNHGGTNEDVARRLFPLAHTELVNTNGRQFEILANLDASETAFTLTDETEARMQTTRLAPRLCLSRSFLTQDTKAFMLPRDDMPWSEYVNAWLHDAWLLPPRMRHGDGRVTVANESLGRWIHETAHNDTLCSRAMGARVATRGSAH